MQVLIGRVTENAKVNTLTDDRQVVNFSMAMNNTFTPKGGEKQKRTTYAQCSYWVGTGIAEYLTKGALVEVAGFISVDAYTNLQGEAKGVLRFHCNAIQLHGGTKSNEKQQETEPDNNTKQKQPRGTSKGKSKAEANSEAVTEPVDDLPF